ncbi:MAG: 2,3-bisphosphoglycerate-independent phosphoglycerate mutase [Alphaproteobacteria bacterium]|nr:2,3-bisphosphoglycerate-independent phosphoglycerate mutase [Alphaproteobacteria bacterium]
MDSATMDNKKPIVLCILDGWGHRAEVKNNAIAQGNTPTWDRLLSECPNSLLETSGHNVGLPDGQMGNSEVGHTNIGAGRIVPQDLPRIDKAVESGDIEKNTALQDLINKLKETSGACHLMGLTSDGGVHSHQKHIAKIAKIVNDAGIEVKIHAFLDGRDTPPTSATKYVKQFISDIKDCKQASICSISGRYYAMDRDNRWDRVEKAYEAVVNAKIEADVEKFSGNEGAITAIENSYNENINDEFVIPCVEANYTGIKDGDGLIVANFRADRAREISAALANPNFDGFNRSKVIKFAACVGLTEHSSAHNAFLSTMYPPHSLSNIFGEVVSKNGLKQLRIAETEKYAHVTFFFNGGQEKEFKGENRILIPSPNVATYDLKPSMSAIEITDNLVQTITSNKCDMIIVNYANGDMVGHTGIWDAAIEAVETIDKCLTRLEKAIKNAGGTMLVTADHGNCEKMRDEITGEPYTAHTVGKVPAILVNAPNNITSINDGALCDIAPTLLELLGIGAPIEMTGKSILVK